jgi:uncharacterized membrane protein YfcA
MTAFSLAVLLTSLGAGAVGAVLGLGGGILLVPILTVFFGVVVLSMLLISLLLAGGAG